MNSFILNLYANIFACVAARLSALRVITAVLLPILVMSATPFAQAQDHPARTTGKISPADDQSSMQIAQSSAAGVDSTAGDAQQKKKPRENLVLQPDPASKQTADQTNGERKGEWVIAPIPVKSPALGAGLQWAVGYVTPFSKQDKVSPPSLVGVAGLFTNNGSRGLGIGARLYLKEDRYRITVAGGHASINADIYGVGKLSGDRGVFVPVNAKGSGLFTDSLFQVSKGIYLGGRFQYRDLRLSIDRQNSDLPGDTEINPPPPIADIIAAIRDNLFRQRTVSLGPRFQWDTRDSTFYPRRGFFLDSGIDLFAKAIGSKFTYQYYKVGFNKYSSLGEHQVLALRGMGCAAAGDRVPVYDLCLFGAMNDLRGYSAGRYQDRRMFAAQAEYRLSIPKQGFLGRFGLVAFGGVGGVGPSFTDIGFSEMLPAGGAGIRFRLTKRNPINFRVDYGVGTTGGTFIVGVGEAF